MNYGKKSDFNFWNIVTVVGLILLGINYINKKDSSIKVTNIGGPLNHLENTWYFNDHKNGTEISFDIDFEIENKFLNIVMTKSFQFGLDKIADAFQKRAKELFGNSKN